MKYFNQHSYLFDKLFYKRIISGLLSFFIKKKKSKIKDIQLTAKYCYSVYLRHLVLSNNAGLIDIPKTIIEIGPGNSLGCGIVALLLGSENYFGLDSPELQDSNNDELIFDEVIKLIRNRSKIPNNEVFPRLKPHLDSYDFPYQIFSDKHIDMCLENNRVIGIKNDLKSNKGCINYLGTKEELNVLKSETVDLIFSQAVLEYVDNLPEMLNSFHRLLTKKGMISHEIDLGSHSTASAWNGHLLYPHFVWKIIKGNYPSFITRRVCSDYVNLIRNANFRILCMIKETRKSRYDQNIISKKHRLISKEDMTTSSLYLLADKTSNRIFKESEDINI